MTFAETSISGAHLIVPEKKADSRGYFARTWCQREFHAHGLDTSFAQCSVSYNQRRGTLRGMHYQVAPHEETKLISCTAGSVFDVIIDLRRDSATFLKHYAVALSARDHTMLYVPAGCAHGFQTLEDETAVFYQISEFHDPASARGVRWNDPLFAIAWPDADRIILERDRTYPDFEPGAQRRAERIPS